MKHLILILGLLLCSQIASATYLGSYVSSSVSSFTNVPGATGAFGDCTSISLPPGDWDLTGVIYVIGNGSTYSSTGFIGISSTAGNDGSGLVFGDSEAVLMGTGLTTEENMNRTSQVVSLRKSITATTTFYLKESLTYTGGPPQEQCRLSARRAR